jgi:hypothetical protein
MQQKLFSNTFTKIAGFAVLLNLLHGLEVSQTNFFISNPNFYPYTKFFGSIPEAVYYVQHGVLYAMLVLFFFFLLGKKWSLVPLVLFGVLLVSETHHFFRSLYSMSYQSGMITSGLFIPISYLYIKQLVEEFKK